MESCVLRRKFVSFTPKRRISVESQKMECYNIRVNTYYFLRKGREYGIEKTKKQTFGDTIDPWIYPR